MGAGGGGVLSKQGARELAERSAHLGGDRYLIKPALVEFISTQSQRRARPVGIAPVCLQVIPCTRVECSSSSESCSTLVAEWRSPRLLSAAPGAITPLSLAVASSAPEAASHPTRAATAIVSSPPKSTHDRLPLLAVSGEGKRNTPVAGRATNLEPHRQEELLGDRVMRNPGTPPARAGPARNCVD